MLLGVMVFVYAYSDPQAYQIQSLEQLFILSNLEVWGTMSAVMAGVSVVCSYMPRFVKAGYILAIVVPAFWCISYSLGFVYYDAPVRALGSALVFGYVMRRINRDFRRYRAEGELR